MREESESSLRYAWENILHAARYANKSYDAICCIREIFLCVTGSMLNPPLHAIGCFITSLIRLLLVYFTEQRSLGLIKKLDAVDLRKKFRGKTSGFNDANPPQEASKTPVPKSKYPEKVMKLQRTTSQKEYAILSASRLTLEDMRDRLIRAAGSAFGKLAKYVAKSSSEPHTESPRMVPSVAQAQIKKKALHQQGTVKAAK